MDNAVTQTVPTPLVPAAPGVAARWRALPARTQTLALLVLAALAVAWALSREPAALRGLLLLAGAWWLVALLWLALAPKSVRDWSAGIAGLFALAPGRMLGNLLLG